MYYLWIQLFYGCGLSLYPSEWAGNTRKLQLLEREQIDTSQHPAALPVKSPRNQSLQTQQNLSLTELVTWHRTPLMWTGNGTVDIMEVSIERIPRQNIGLELPVTRSPMARVLMSSVVTSWNRIFSSNVSCSVRPRHSRGQLPIPKSLIQRRRQSGRRQSKTEHWVIMVIRSAQCDGKTKRLESGMSLAIMHEHRELIRSNYLLTSVLMDS